MATYRNVEVPNFLTPDLIQSYLDCLEGGVEDFICLAIDYVLCDHMTEQRLLFQQFLRQLKIRTDGAGFSEDHAPEWLLPRGATPKERRINFLKDIKCSIETPQSLPF